LEPLDELRQEVERLRERSSKLNSVILRINASLDVNTVLREIVDSARALTGARYGVIATVAGSGEITEFVSSGFTADEHERMASWPDGPRLFTHLQELPAPVRLSNLPAYVEELGFSSDLMRSKTLLGVTMRHRDVPVGSFFLGEKEGGQDFTDDDEEILVLLASQAGAGIANARTYADEQRTRAELETLVENAPVGVVIFDVTTERPGSVSFNQEARRIVDGLRMPGHSPEDLLAVITFRRSDGRETSLDEFPIAGQLSTGEKVHAEEIELRTPDGRSVTTLINAMPIHAATGDVQTVVVTMQDLSSLQELERLRAEFMALVGHELRTPLTSIKGAAMTALGTTPALDREELIPFFHIINEQADHVTGLVHDLLDAGRIETGTLSVTPEPLRVVDLVQEARSVFLNSSTQHTLRLDLPLDLPPVNADRRRIVQVLNNLFVNAARHSPPYAPIRVSAVRDGIFLAISVTDEGRGVPAEALPNLFRKHSGLRAGDSQAPSEATGLGLAICKGLVEAHGGRIWAESGGVNQGTRFTFTLAVADEEAAPAALASAASSARGDRKTGVLVVDDDPQTLRYVKEALGSKGYSVVTTGDPQETPGLIRTHRPQLVLLDLLFTGTDGVELMEQIPELEDLPVIFISAYGRDETIARALEAGAVDYIVKPFSPTELTARVRAALRRHAEPAPFNLGALTIHHEQRRVTLDGRPLDLTATEYEMLRVLSKNAGRVTTYDSLLRRVWGSKNSTDPKLVRSFVKKLRKKLKDDPAKPAYIFTERGVGYRMPGSEGEPG